MDRKLILAAILAVAAAILAVFIVFSREENVVVAKIGGDPVSLGEYYIYLYEQKVLFENIGGSDIWEINFDGETAEEVAKRNALQRISLVRAALLQAKSMGITLSNEERDTAYESAKRLLEGINAQWVINAEISLDAVVAIMEDIQIFNKVYESVTQNVALSESDFADYFEQYQMENESELSPRTSAELAEIEDVLRNSYLETKQRDVFNEIFAKWTADVKTEIVYDVWETIYINDG